MAELPASEQIIDVQATPVAEDPAQVFAANAQASAQKAAVLKRQEEMTNQGNAVGATAAVAVGGGFAYKATQAVGKVANPDALAKDASGFIAKQAEKIGKSGNGFFRMFKPDKNQIAERAQKLSDKAIKEAGRKFGKDSAMTAEVREALSGVMPRNAQDIISHYNTGEGAQSIKQAAVDTVEKNPEWLKKAATTGKELWGRIPGKPVVIGTAIVGGALLGHAAYKKAHEGGQQQSDMLKQQIAVAEAEAAQYGQKAEQARQWQQTVGRGGGLNPVERGWAGALTEQRQLAAAAGMSGPSAA